MKIEAVVSISIIAMSLMSSCKTENKPAPQADSEIQFVPVAAGAAYGIGIST
ncbi:MAG: hypothetical protein RJB13_868, partial [Pseudomonadota bacterium]